MRPGLPVKGVAALQFLLRAGVQVHPGGEMGVLLDQDGGALPLFIREDEGDDLPVLRPQ